MNDTEWFAEHTAYLATPEWAFRRGQVLNRDGYRCQARLQGCAGEATQAHHLSYKHWRNEPLFELVSVCANCHEAITAMDRDNRPPERRLQGNQPAALAVWERAPLGEDRPSAVELIGEELRNGPLTSRELADRLGFSREVAIRILRRSPDRFHVVSQMGSEHVWSLGAIGMDIPRA